MLSTLVNTEQYLDDFVSYLKDSKKATENTWQSYARDLRQFFQYLENIGQKNIDDVKKVHVDNYVSSLVGNGRAASSISRCIASIRAFYRYLRANDMSTADPTRGVQTVRHSKKLPETLTVEEVNLLLMQPETDSYRGQRDKAMLEMLYATGIKVSELISLNLHDANLEVGYITCRTEDKRRDIPLYQAAKKALQVYVRHARDGVLHDPDEQALFLNCNGSRITRQGFWKLLKNYQESAGIQKEITPQVLRNSFAVHLLENGADLKSIQEMLGHNDISSTQVYVNVLKSKIRKVYFSVHPRATEDSKK